MLRDVYKYPSLRCTLRLHLYLESRMTFQKDFVEEHHVCCVSFSSPPKGQTTPAMIHLCPAFPKCRRCRTYVASSPPKSPNGIEHDPALPKMSCFQPSCPQHLFWTAPSHQCKVAYKYLSDAAAAFSLHQHQKYALSLNS
jgi:hypothetical protein